MTHLATDGHDDFIIRHPRLRLDDDWSDLEAAVGGLFATTHEVDCGVVVVLVPFVVEMRKRPAMDTGRIFQVTRIRFVVVGHTDKPRTIFDPDVGLGDDRVDTVESGERHVFFLVFGFLVFGGFLFCLGAIKIPYDRKIVSLLPEPDKAATKQPLKAIMPSSGIFKT